MATTYDSKYASGEAVDAALDKAESAVASNTTGVTGADRVTNIISLTQAEYNVITPDAATLYVVVG